MSTTDEVFVAAGESLEETVGWVGRALRLEGVGDPELGAEEFLFRGKARTAGGDLVIVVEPNTYSEPDPEPDDVSAIDRYAVVVEVRLVGARDEEAQAREARAVFDELSADRPEVALVLSHALSLLKAAYLPGVGARTFPAGTTLDAPDVDAWRAWVR
ncbi:hypothetical protein [Kribbella sp. CA-247076]|uniref:hypothetical protein n=1 Tax=Kribbella sp. CA-247076 TaxID=3239941 RepID=UPI003D8E0588